MRSNRRMEKIVWWGASRFVLLAKYYSGDQVWENERWGMWNMWESK
jgi:hypothetical protein